MEAVARVHGQENQKEQSKRGVSAQFGVRRKWSWGKQLSGLVEERERACVGGVILWEPGRGEVECKTSASGNITMQSAADVSVCPTN